ncbi:NAD-dependent deacylase [Nocardioides gilvus]|uniref:NAD-dependent deacylase n=1 Tax=Nocardioides gilvus TaxID=1735589 RepID=UPI000D74DBA3|nr:NAD-dependent deacylase [Nocardioides gilvus]
MKIVVLTGAGISAESGVPTFRDADGLWEGHDVMQVASPEGFEADPELVQRFYDLRRAHLTDVEPNAAHLALGRLEKTLGPDLLVITQNVDDLHERGGSTNVLHMHGELRSALCLACADRFEWDGDLSHAPACPGCGAATLRPDIVWFGEIPYRMEEALQALQEADLFVSVGTSSQVYPAAAFVHWAAEQGARTLELNMNGTIASEDFDEVRTGPAGTLVPAWVDELLDGL